MRLQIASDLHLESRPKQTFREFLEPGVAPCLALLGDVAPLQHENLQPFLEWCSENWETVLWIPGKAELLQGRATTLEQAIEDMRRVAAPYLNIQVLDHEGMVSSDGIYIFGLPFWKFPNDDGQIWNPYFHRYVDSEPSPIPAAVARALYNYDIRWLQSKIKSQKEPVVILSHFGPTTWIQEEGFIGDPNRSIMFPDIEQLLKPPIVAWLCGHTHHSVLTQKEWGDPTGTKGSVLIATNPRGLPFENLEYKTDAVIRIDPRLYRA